MLESKEMLDEKVLLLKERTDFRPVYFVLSQTADPWVNDVNTRVHLLELGNDLCIAGNVRETLQTCSVMQTTQTVTRWFILERCKPGALLLS